MQRIRIRARLLGARQQWAMLSGFSRRAGVFMIQRGGNCGRRTAAKAASLASSVSAHLKVRPDTNH